MKQLQKVGKLNMFLVCMVKNFDDKTYKADYKKDSYRNRKHASLRAILNCRKHPCKLR